MWIRTTWIFPCGLASDAGADGTVRAQTQAIQNGFDMCWNLEHPSEWDRNCRLPSASTFDCHNWVRSCPGSWVFRKIDAPPWGQY